MMSPIKRFISFTVLKILRSFDLLDFDNLLKRFDGLETYLIDKEKPVYEAEIIRNFFPEISITQLKNIELYKIHFALFHKLYQSKKILENKNFFVSVNFMRIAILRLPNVGFCRFYNFDTNSFCLETCEHNYCNIHSFNDDENKLLDLNSIEFFYLDTENLSFLNDEELDKWLYGFNSILNNYPYFKEAVQCLNLPEDFKLSELKNQYRKLALKFHPDHKPDNQNNFFKVNRAYQFLLKCVQ